MITAQVEALFDESFTYLGRQALYLVNKLGIETAYPVLIMLKSPDQLYEASEAVIAENAAIIEVRAKDIEDPKIGDKFMIDGLRYKIYAPATKDSSGLLWRILAIEEKER